MDPNRYTQLADQAGERYINMLAVFRSLLFQAQPHPFTNSSAKALKQGALTVARSFMTTEMEHISSALRETALESIRTAQTDVSVSPVSGVPKDLEAFLAQSESFLEGELSSQIMRDADSLVKRYREFAVEANLVQRSTGASPRQAVAAVGNVASERVRFQFRDRGGRLYASSKLSAPCGVRRWFA